MLQAQSKSREISGTLFQRIKSQICLQPYHGYTNLKAGREIVKGASLKPVEFTE
jgi:hypothetical protein